VGEISDNCRGSCGGGCVEDVERFGEEEWDELRMVAEEGRFGDEVKRIES
jgi:hypothetical protein